MKYTEFRAIFTVKFGRIPRNFAELHAFGIPHVFYGLTKFPFLYLTYTIGKRRETHEYTWKCLGISSMWWSGHAYIIGA
jgi:hypothetical protein